jgi:hypothetical protein
MSLALSRRLTDSSSKPASRSFLQIASSPAAPTGDRGLAMAGTLDLDGGGGGGDERARSPVAAAAGQVEVALSPGTELLFPPSLAFRLRESRACDGELGVCPGFLPGFACWVVVGGRRVWFDGWRRDRFWMDPV